MILDAQNMFSDGQAITATAASTNQIDLGATGTAYGAAAALTADVGKDNEIPLLLTVTQAFNNLTSLQVTLQTDMDVAFGSPKEVASRTYTLAELGTGIKTFPACVMEGSDERYLRLNYTVTGVAPTTGKITAAIVAARQTH